MVSPGAGVKMGTVSLSGSVWRCVRQRTGDDQLIIDQLAD